MTTNSSPCRARQLLATSFALLLVSASPLVFPADPAPPVPMTFGAHLQAQQSLADGPNGTVPWRLLKEVQLVKSPSGKYLPEFSAAVRKIDRQQVKVHGFMLPLDTGETQQHFLLCAYPPTCPYCLPGGADSMVEVYAAKPVKFTWDAVIVSGDMELMHDDPAGLYYRLSAAKTE
jgi:uncharacterized protein